MLSKNISMLEAARALKEGCSKISDCGDCDYDRKKGCLFQEEVPGRWELSEPKKPVELQPFKVKCKTSKRRAEFHRLFITAGGVKGRWSYDSEGVYCFSGNSGGLIADNDKASFEASPLPRLKYKDVIKHLKAVIASKGEKE